MTGLLLGILLAFALSAPAALAGTAEVAPIGSGGSYVVTVKSTGSESISGFVLGVGETPVPTNIVPSTCKYGASPFAGALKCGISIPPGGQGQMCYTGHFPYEDFPGEPVLLETSGPMFASLTTVAAVSSCPVAGFNGGSGAGAKCVVPNVKGKKLATAEKSITGAHCKVGKITKASNKHVKKGSVISESPSSGASKPNGTKVNLVVSK